MNQQLRRKLDHITNVLWAGGVTNPVTYIEQISYLIFLKLLDEEETDRELRARLSTTNGNAKLLFPQQAERYRWSKWRFKSGEDLRNFIRDEVFPYMASLAKDEPEVAEYFRDAVLEIVDPNVLKQVIDELDGFEFRKLGPDVKGDIFEYLLTHLGQSALNGQFRTPSQIRAFMVEMTDPDIGDSIFDPACGTGGFLIDAVSYLLAKYSERVTEHPIYGDEWLERRGQTVGDARKAIPNLQTFRKGAGEKIPDWKLLEASIHGFDVSRQMMRISMMNLVLHGIRHARLKRANALSEMGGLTEDDLRRRYKVILSNPPFAGQLPKDSIRQDLPTNSKKSELLFLSVMMQSLAPGGRCAVVVPEGLLFGSTTAHVELRKKLVIDFDLLAVVSLPAGAFKPYAGVKTAVLVFRKPVSDGAKRMDKIWFYEVLNDGFDTEKISSGGRIETPELNDIPDLLSRWREYKLSGFARPPGLETNSIVQPTDDRPYCWYASREFIEHNDWNLAAGRYRPHSLAVVPQHDPVVLSSGITDAAQHISAALSTLDLASSNTEDVAGWPIVKLEALAAPEKGSIKIGPFGSELKKSELVSSGVHVVGIENVLSRTFDGLGDRYISEGKFSTLRGFEVKAGDVLITMMGTIGEVAVVPEGISTSIMDSHLLRFRPNREICLPEYVALVIRGSADTRAAIRGRAHGAIMKGLNSGIVRALPAALPPLSEQEEIVRFFERLFDVESRAAAIREKLELLEEVLFHRAFAGSLTSKWRSCRVNQLREEVARQTKLLSSVLAPTTQKGREK